MTALAQRPQFSSPVSNPLPRWLAGLGRAFALLDASRRAAGAYEKLSMLSDAELARRGLSRHEIAAVAMRELSLR